MPPVLVLIGPAGAGKTTLGEQVARRLGRTFVDLDAVAEPFYADVGWSLERLVREIDKVGRYDAEVAWEHARLHATRRAVDKSEDAVLALGAGHTTYTCPRRQQELAEVLGKARHVVFLEPFPARDDSLRELRRRSVQTKQTNWISNGHDILADWLDDPVPRTLTDHVLYTGARPVHALLDDLEDIVSSG